MSSAVQFILLVIDYLLPCEFNIRVWDFAVDPV